MNFYQRLRSIQKKTNSLLCIGLDPDLTGIPAFLRRGRNPIYEFNRRIIDATADLVCAFKLNLAFYEADGVKGWRTLEKTLEEIPPGVLTIGDGKRGDIANTATLYARSLFEVLGFDAVTVNPYMGRDSVEPFLANPAKGVFILALTSNPGSGDFQQLTAGGRRLFQHVVAAAKRWNVRNNCGLVVGATKPAELHRIREAAPEMPILIPGVGAQGGDLREAVRSGCTARGDFALINVGRSVLYASGGKDFATASRAAARQLRDMITMHRESFFT
jgi:orotidine-5'-phosphate decarboxylase